MTAKKKGEKWYVVKKDGKLGSRGYSTQKNALNAQRTARANAAKRSGKSKKTSKPSTKPSNPAGGAKTTVKEKLGVIARKIRTMLNFVGPAVGQWHYLTPTQGAGLDTKVGQITEHYIAYNTKNRNWNADSVWPTYQGIGTSMLNDWFDRKTRKSTKISKGKIVHILTEGIPAFQAYNDAEAGPETRWFHTFVRSYNKYTDGYDMVAHDWSPGRMKYYAWGKIAAYVSDVLVSDDLKRGINSAFPKGVNPL